jgi:hypothetical protein
MLHRTAIPPQAKSRGFATEFGGSHHEHHPGQWHQRDVLHVVRSARAVSGCRPVDRHAIRCWRGTPEHGLPARAFWTPEFMLLACARRGLVSGLRSLLEKVRHPRPPLKNSCQRSLGNTIGHLFRNCFANNELHPSPVNRCPLPVTASLWYRTFYAASHPTVLTAR